MSKVTALEAIGPGTTNLLLECARGLDKSEIGVKYGLTPGQVNWRFKVIYKGLGVFDMGHQSRAFALSIAARRFGLPAPVELIPAVTLMSAPGFEFEEERDLIVLRLVAEGYKLDEIAAQLDEDHSWVSTRLAAMRLLTGLDLYPPFCVATAAIWAGLFKELDLERPFEPTPDDVDLFYDIILERPPQFTADRLHITRDAARAKLAALNFRMGVKTQAEVIDRAVRAGWVELPSDEERLVEAKAVVAEAKLSPLEFVLVRLLGKGKSRKQIQSLLRALPKMEALLKLEAVPDLGKEYTHQQIGQLLAGELASSGIDWVLTLLYRRVGVHDATALIAVAVWAGEPLAEPGGPEDVGFDGDDIKQLVGVALGETGEEIAKRIQARTTSISNIRLSKLYRRMGVINAVHAVAVATRDGLLDGWFESGGVDFDAVVSSRFSSLYIGLLQLQANGIWVRDAPGHLGVSSLGTLQKRVKGDRDRMTMHLNTTVAILVRLGEIKVTYPPAKAEPAPSAVTQTSYIVSKAGPLIEQNRTNPAVVRGRTALSQSLGMFLGSNFEQCVAAIRAGDMPRPWWPSRFDLTQLDPVAAIFLSELAAGQSLDELRAQSATPDTEEFLRWYMQQVCAPLGAPGPRQAVCIALWQQLIE